MRKKSIHTDFLLTKVKGWLAQCVSTKGDQPASRPKIFYDFYFVKRKKVIFCIFFYCILFIQIYSQFIK